MRADELMCMLLDWLVAIELQPGRDTVIADRLRREPLNEPANLIQN